MTQLLWIDDNDRLARFAQRFLERSLDDLEVRSAATLLEARKALEAYRFDLVVLDDVLPDGRGSSFLADLRRAAPGARVVMTTGMPLETLSLELAGESPDAWLRKPFEIRDLAEKLMTCLAWGRPA